MKARHEQMLVWFQEHKSPDRTALVSAITHGRSIADESDSELSQNAFMAIAADLAVLEYLIEKTGESAIDLNHDILRLFVEGIETRARAAAGLMERRREQDAESSPKPDSTERASMS